MKLLLAWQEKLLVISDALVVQLNSTTKRETRGGPRDKGIAGSKQLKTRTQFRQLASEQSEIRNELRCERRYHLRSMSEKSESRSDTLGTELLPAVAAGPRALLPPAEQQQHQHPYATTPDTSRCWKELPFHRTSQIGRIFFRRGRVMATELVWLSDNSKKNFFSGWSSVSHHSTRQTGEPSLCARDLVCLDSDNGKSKLSDGCMSKKQR